MEGRIGSGDKIAMTLWALAAFALVLAWGAVGWLLFVGVERQRQRERGYYYQALGAALMKDWDEGDNP